MNLFALTLVLYKIPLMDPHYASVYKLKYIKYGFRFWLNIDPRPLFSDDYPCISVFFFPNKICIGPLNMDLHIASAYGLEFFRFINGIIFRFINGVISNLMNGIFLFINEVIFNLIIKFFSPREWGYP